MHTDLLVSIKLPYSVSMCSCQIKCTPENETAFSVTFKECSSLGKEGLSEVMEWVIKEFKGFLSGHLSKPSPW